MSVVRRGDLDDVLDELFRRLSELETGSPVGFTSITRGALRVASAEGLIVEGSARVSGTLIVSGEQEVDGQLTITGTLIVSGDAEISGPTTITGTFGIDGNTTITGDVTLTGDFTVAAGGKITVGAMVLDPSNNGGSVKFSGGPEVYASGSELSLYSTGSGGYITLNGSTAEVHGPGVVTLRLTSSGIQLGGLPTVPLSSAPSGAFVGAVVSDSSGNLRRVVTG